jgi:biotin operon repressor
LFGGSVETEATLPIFTRFYRPPTGGFFITIMEYGFIKLSRKILDWRYYKDLNVFKVFMHLLLHASYVDKYNEFCILKKGQLTVNVDNMGDKLGLSKKQVRLALKKLEADGTIVLKGTNKYTLITICKWEDYQCLDSQQGQSKANQKENQSEPKDNQRSSIKEGNKEIIKEGNKESVYTRENFIDDLLGEFKTDADLRSVTKTWLQKKKVITEKSMQISKAEIQGHNKSEMYAAIMAAADKGWAQLYSRKDKQSKGTSTSLPAGKPWLDPATIAAAKASAERLKKLENRSEGVTQF